MSFVVVPTPNGEYWVAAEHVTWFCQEFPADLETPRSLMWLDDGHQVTVLLAASELAAALAPGAQARAEPKVVM